MADMPLVSAIIVTWNRRAELNRCLQSLFAQDYPNLEVTVVDNASTDGTPKMVRREFPAARLIVMDRNRGCAGGRSHASPDAAGEYLFYMDDDAVAGPSVVSGLVARLEQDPRLALVTPRRVDGDPDAMPASLEPLPPIRCLGLFSSCAVMVRKGALAEIGGFPADHAYGVAETDLAVRFMHAGYRMEALHDVVIWHTRTPAMRDDRREFRFVYRNTVRSLWRRAPFGLAVAGTAYAVGIYGYLGLKRRYPLTHLQVTCGLAPEIARILLRRERRPVRREAYSLMEYLEDHWVSSWDDIDPRQVRRYGSLWRAAWRRLRGRRATSRITVL